MQKVYNLVIGEDSIPYMLVPFDDTTGKPERDWENMENMLNCDPTILDISSLEYYPRVGTKMKDGHFLTDDPTDTPKVELNKDGITYKRYAFLDKNVYMGEIAYPENGEADAYIAILSSNPKVVFSGIKQND